MLGAVFREWFSWIYPFVCEWCGRGNLDACHVCPECRKTFSLIEPPYCAACGK